MMDQSITHLTSVHKRDDTRVFLKICSSLAEQGYNTSLIVADGQGDAIANHVKIFDVGISKSNRLFRMIFTVYAIYRQAVALDSSIYHFHDPELIPIGLLLKIKGKKVIFDSHEDHAGDILHKQYIPSFLRNMLSHTYKSLERFAAKRFDAIVAATPKIAEIFGEYPAKKVANINNYPLLSELSEQTSQNNKTIDALFVGAISSIRGVYELVQSLDAGKPFSLSIAGTFASADIEQKISSLTSWPRVQYLGQIPRKQALELLASSKIGIVTYLPAPNHIDSQPNKLFEYMSAGIPVVASDFPLWKEIVEGNNCGICVDPKNPEALNHAIHSLLENPEKSAQMGENGKLAVCQKYNWEMEKIKLLQLYRDLFA